MALLYEHLSRLLYVRFGSQGLKEVSNKRRIRCFSFADQGTGVSP
jgi:hypothetical protein